MSGIATSLAEQAVFVYGEFSFPYEALRRLFARRHLQLSSPASTRKRTAGVQEFQAAYKIWLETENLPMNAKNEMEFRKVVWPNLQETATLPAAPTGP